VARVWHCPPTPI